MNDADIPNELAIPPQRLPIGGLTDTGAPEQPRPIDRPMDEGAGGKLSVKMSISGHIYTVLLTGRIVT